MNSHAVNWLARRHGKRRQVQIAVFESAADEHDLARQRAAPGFRQDGALRSSIAIAVRRHGKGREQVGAAACRRPPPENQGRGGLRFLAVEVREHLGEGRPARLLGGRQHEAHGLVAKRQLVALGREENVSRLPPGLGDEILLKGHTLSRFPAPAVDRAQDDGCMRLPDRLRERGVFLRLGGPVHDHVEADGLGARLVDALDDLGDQPAIDGRNIVVAREAPLIDPDNGDVVARVRGLLRQKIGSPVIGELVGRGGQQLRARGRDQHKADQDRKQESRNAPFAKLADVQGSPSASGLARAPSCPPGRLAASNNIIAGACVKPWASFKDFPRRRYLPGMART